MIIILYRTVVKLYIGNEIRNARRNVYPTSYIFRYKHTNSPGVQHGGSESGNSKFCCTKSCDLTSWKPNVVEETACDCRSEITQTADVRT